MRVYQVTYVTSDYSDKTSVKTVVATSVSKAAEALGKKITGYSGRVKTVEEVYSDAVVAK